jgi:hypothetical protein
MTTKKVWELKNIDASLTVNNLYNHIESMVKKISNTKFTGEKELIIDTNLKNKGSLASYNQILDTLKTRLSLSYEIDFDIKNLVNDELGNNP